MADPLVGREVFDPFLHMDPIGRVDDGATQGMRVGGRRVASRGVVRRNCGVGWVFNLNRSNDQFAECLAEWILHQDFMPMTLSLRPRAPL